MTSPATCNCEEWMRSACHGPSSYEGVGGERYCILHFPDRKKSDDFRKALNEKLEAGDFNFRGVWFPDELTLSTTSFDANATFAAATFKENADFDRVEFLKHADFKNATFEKGANFFHANFDRANFDDAIFKENATFEEASFKGSANFSSANFHQRVIFNSATFQYRARFDRIRFTAEANFHLTIFRDYVSFAGNEDNQTWSEQSRLDLREAKIDKPELVAFRTLELRPHWFVDVDPRKFEFTKVKWRSNINEELKSLSKLKGTRDHKHDLLVIACQRLAINSQENDYYDDASTFRYMTVDVRRLQKRWPYFAIWKLNWWYWLASGYSERVGRAALVLVGLLFFFASIFFVGQRYDPQWWQSPQVRTQETTLTAAAKAGGDNTSRLSGFREALIYSAEVMTLQKPEPLPASKFARTLVLLETVLGPVQAALLALAIRRKFMR